MPKLFQFVIISAIFALFLSFGSFVYSAPPAGFQKTTLISSGLNNPTGFEILPDGRVFIIEQTGAIKLYKNGQLLAQPFDVLPAKGENDRGLLGIAVDPLFSSNNYLYFRYVGLDDKHHVVRYVATGDAATQNPVEIYSTDYSQASNHAGGSIQFGPDEKLYISFGDSNTGSSQDLGTVIGKVIRINNDGTIPSDNPYVGQSGKKPEIWASGFRNPFRFQFDFPTNRLFLGDVGSENWEEINIVNEGGNYGWPDEEGNCGSCSYDNPLYSYEHVTPSFSVSGGMVYRGNVFPQEYYGSYFFGDFAQGFIKRLTLDSNGNFAQVFDFDSSAGSVVDMRTAPDGSIYYLNIFPGSLNKISYSSGNQIPTSVSSANQTTNPTAPFTVNFSSSGSSDPENVPLSYLWTFGDGTTSTQANPQKTFNSKGQYQVLLRVSDGVHGATALPINIVVGTPPTLTINLPIDESTYKAGDTINYSSSAKNSNNQDLPDSAFSTLILFHHSSHTHPFVPESNTRTGSFVIPTSGEPATNVWYKITVTATDSDGLKTTKDVEIRPQISSYSISANPPGLMVLVDGIPTSTPATIPAVVGFKPILAAYDQSLSGTAYEFDNWSDGGAKSHAITVAQSNTNYQANYRTIPPFNASYFNNKNLTGSPVLNRLDPVIEFDWGSGGSPHSSIPNDNFSARWTKTQFFNQGRYKFVTTTDDGARLYIDNQLIINKWQDQGSTSHEAVIDLLTGPHEIKMEYYESGGGANAYLEWDSSADPVTYVMPTPTVTATPTPTPSPTPTPTPVSGGYSAEYYDNISLSGQPKLTRNEQLVNFVWNHLSPDSVIPNDNFSARWTRTETLSEGLYEITVTADDGIRVYVDNNLVIDRFIDQPSTTYTTTLGLANGSHIFRVEYYERTGGAVAKFDYKKISGYEAKFWNTSLPYSQPSLPSGSPNYVTTQEVIKNYWNNSSPNSAVGNDHFAGVWTKSLKLDAGNYQFDTISDDGVRVFVNDQLIINQWNDHASTTHSAVQNLSSGTHNLKIEYYENSGGALLEFGLKKVPVVPISFNAEYFDNVALTGTPKLTRSEQNLNFNWGSGSPDSLIPNDNFSARWTKTQSFVAGIYTFTLKSDDGIRFYVDNQLIVDDWSDHATRTYTPTVNLTAGNHVLKIEYYEKGGQAVAIFAQN